MTPNSVIVLSASTVITAPAPASVVFACTSANELNPRPASMMLSPEPKGTPRVKTLANINCVSSGPMELKALRGHVNRCPRCRISGTQIAYPLR